MSGKNISDINLEDVPQELYKFFENISFNDFIKTMCNILSPKQLFRLLFNDPYKPDITDKEFEALKQAEGTVILVIKIMKVLLKEEETTY